MASAYTEAEITTMLTEIKAAISAALLGKSYELNTGQSLQKVTRQDLPNLRALLAEYEGRLDEFTGTGGLEYIN